MDSFETSTRMQSDEGMFSDDVTMVTGLGNWTTGLSPPPPPPPPHIAAMKQANKITLIIILVFLMLAMGCVVQPKDFKEVVCKIILNLLLIFYFRSVQNCSKF